MRTRDKWREHVEQWTSSGLTTVQYSERAGINPRTLAYWKWRLGRCARERRAIASSGGNGLPVRRPMGPPFRRHKKGVAVGSQASTSASSRVIEVAKDRAAVAHRDDENATWETAIKVHLGKLTVDAPSAEAFFDEQMRTNGFTYVPIMTAVAQATYARASQTFSLRSPRC